jgi:hypothetical protein
MVANNIIQICRDSSNLRHFHFGENNNAGTGLEQALDFHFDLLADV